MLNAQIINILACPACKEPLEVASSEVISNILKHLHNGNLPSVEAGLLCKKHNRLFVVREEVPILLFDETISLG
jgi:uncharacterized protein YbaR (Trm112 family)